MPQKTYSNLEILLVDDGSDDGTEKLVDELAREDRRIRAFHKPNGGSSSARNMGICQAAGKYLGFVDSDDYIEPGMYERLMGCIGETGVSIAQVSRDEIDESGNRLPNVCEPPKEAYLCSGENFMRELLLHRGDCSYCTKLTDRRLFEKNRFPEEVLNEDFHLLVEMLGETDRIAILPEQDYHVFYRYGSNTRTRDEEEFPQVFTDIVKNADRVQEIVKEAYPELIPEAMRFGLFQRLDYMLHIPISQMNKKNDFYMQVRDYLKKHRKDALRSPYLTKKNKQYLFLLGTAPALVRKAHRALKRQREKHE